MTQKQIILKYIDLHGSILPAKMAGETFHGAMFGSETSKRCREMRSAGLLYSEKDGKFERFFSIASIHPAHSTMQPLNTLFAVNQLIQRQ